MANKPISLEFYPPKTDEQREQLRRTVNRLKKHEPLFASVTCGAGGSTLSYTPETVRELRQEHGLDGVPHVSCMGGTREELASLLQLYRALGCTRIVALRGDLPSGMARMGDFRFASELVEFIRETQDGHFRIEVGCYPEMHPQAEDALADLRHFKAKVDAGADSAITQYFFNRDAYWSFVDTCAARGISIPIVPGIMPIHSAARLARFSDACGAEIPRWIAKRMAAYGDDAESVREFAADMVASMCRRLVDAGGGGSTWVTSGSASPGGEAAGPTAAASRAVASRAGASKFIARR